MQSKIVIVLLSCLVIGSLSTLLVASKQKTRLISPIPDTKNRKVLGENIIKIPTNTPTPTPTLTPTSTQIPTPTPTPIIVTSSELEELFTRFANEYSVDKELLKRIANCESGLNPNATSRNYAGLFQFSEGLWITTRTLMGQNSDINLRLNAEEAIRTAAFMVSQNHLAIWPNCSK